MVPASGAAAALQQPFDDAASEEQVAAVYQFPRIEPTSSRQRRLQEEVLQANIAERMARGEIDTTQRHQVLFDYSDKHIDQASRQSDQSIFSSAFLHIPR